MIKTLHITNAFHETSGGVSTAYQALMAAANRLERPMVLLAPGERSTMETVGAFGRIYRIRAPRAPVIDSRYRLILPDKYLPGSSSEIGRILLREQPDLVEVCDKFSLNWLGGLIREGWFKGLRRPTLVGSSCERMDDNVVAHISTGPAWQRFSEFYVRIFYVTMFDFHIANSDYTADELLRATDPLYRDRIRVCHAGVDSERFRPSRRAPAVRQRLVERAGGGDRTILLLYVGRLSREKNVGLLVDTMSDLARDADRDFRLLVAGSGPMAHELEAGPRLRASGRLRLLGHIADREALADLYANCDAFVHPNPKEPFGIAPLEAMASDCPVVVPNSGGVISYANNENAWVAEPSGAAFAAAVRSVFSDPQAAAAKVAVARRAVEEHQWPLITGKLFDLYDELHEIMQDRRARGTGQDWKRHKQNPFHRPLVEEG